MQSVNQTTSAASQSGNHLGRLRATTYPPQASIQMPEAIKNLIALRSWGGHSPGDPTVHAHWVPVNIFTPIQVVSLLWLIIYHARFDDSRPRDSLL